MAKPTVAYGSLQLAHGANNRSGQFIWYINRSILNVIDMSLGKLELKRESVPGQWTKPLTR